MPRIATRKPAVNQGDNVPLEAKDQISLLPLTSNGVTDPIPAPAPPVVTFEQILAALKVASLGAAIKAYIQFRDKRDRHNKIKKETNVQMDRIAAVILAKMNKASEGEELPADIKAMLTEVESPDGEKIEGFRVGDHIVYRYTLETWSVPNPEMFRNYVMTTDPPLYNLVTFTPVKDECNAFLEEYGEPPDGAQQNRFHKLGVKKA